MLLQDLQITESIEDKGIFKALFLAGIPGAGKSYTIKKIQDGAISARIVNTDRFFEFFGKKHKIKLNTDENSEFIWNNFEHRISTLNKNSLSNYINSMLPLIIDSTSISPTNLLLRVGILESLGYDTTLVFLDTDLNVALDRNNKRDRRVPDDFIKQSYEMIKKSEKFYRSKFSSFIKIDNPGGEMSEESFQEAFKKTRRFFHAPVSNPIGQHNVEQIRKNNWKYLTPNIIEKSELDSKINFWYHS